MINNTSNTPDHTITNNKPHNIKLRNEYDEVYNKRDEQKEMILHDILITILISIMNGLFDIVFAIIQIMHHITSTMYHLTTNNKYMMDMMNIFIHFVILPVIDSLYPICDLGRKFEHIIKLYKTDYCNDNNDETSDSDYDIELTQDIWNFYVLHLRNLDKSDKVKFDPFDILISQKIEQINTLISHAISKSDTKPKYITFTTFNSILFVILGDAVNIRYRSTHNKVFFVGIFGDDSPYRKFKWYDVI